MPVVFLGNSYSTLYCLRKSIIVSKLLPAFRCKIYLCHDRILIELTLLTYSSYLGSVYLGTVLR